MITAASAIIEDQKSKNARWVQLALGMACMILIANLQYGWTLFVNPINKAHGWSIASIQLAFSIFIALETWLTPFSGWVVDAMGATWGPKLVVAFGGIAVAGGWAIEANADTLTSLYAGASLAGIGGGAIYATCVGQAVKWFPDKRGLAVGLTAAGYGAGAALTVIPIRGVIESRGYAEAFFWFGLVQGGLAFVVAWFMRAPEPGEADDFGAPRVKQTARNYTPVQVLASPVFWLLYVMFVLVSASGLMATAQIAVVARDLNVANAVLLFGTTTLTLALIVDNVANGAARPLFGWVSDHLGREFTMAIAFGLGGLAFWLLGQYGTSPINFVFFAALIFLTWGEIFSLFPSTCTDTFGTKYATANLGLLYTAKGTSAFLVPLANVIKSQTGSWHAVFLISAATNFVVVALAILVLLPLRRRTLNAA